MPQAAQRRPDDDDFDERGILRDGGRSRVDARFVDAHDRAVIDELRRRNPPRVDAFAHRRPHAAIVDSEAVFRWANVASFSTQAVAAAFVLWLALISIGSPALAQQNGMAAGEAEAAVEEWLTAVSSGDPARIEAVLAPEFQIQRADGSGYTKADYLATGLPRIPSVPVVANLVATAHNNSLMVVRYTITLPPETTIGGEAVAPMAPRLTVFRREGDKWLVSAHANFAQPTR